jgi:hypothetical protein
MRAATSRIAGSFTATTTRSWTPSACGSDDATTRGAISVPPLRSRMPCALIASSVAPRATADTAWPCAASRAPMKPPMAPAP